jgi:hypothetical protein
LLASTLLNNYKAIYLVNNKSLLKPSLFKPARPHKFVEYRSSSLLITSKGKKMIKLILNIAQELKTKDLELNNITVIKGFYINIVLEACLLKTGV